MTFGQLLLGHMIGLVIGFVLDAAFGDPPSMPHPIRLIGKLIDKLDTAFMGEKGREIRHDKGKERGKGILLVILVAGLTGLVTALIVVGTWLIHPALGVAAEAILTYYLLAARSLKVESMKVYTQLKRKNLEKARYAVSMIVGRDTESLDAKGVTKAAVETVAENASDGVIAPLLYTAFLGPVAGFVYKSINTMDSMVGYKNERYQYFGTAAAKTDDVVNFLPARLSALLMIASAYLFRGTFDGPNALKIWRRDRRKHASPNSAQTEAVCAGALCVRLAGDASYFGVIHHKPTIGDPILEIEPEDIPRANKLMYASAVLALVLYLAGAALVTAIAL